MRIGQPGPMGSGIAADCENCAIVLRWPIVTKGFHIVAEVLQRLSEGSVWFG